MCPAFSDDERAFSQLYFPSRGSSSGPYISRKPPGTTVTFLRCSSSVTERLHESMGYTGWAGHLDNSCAACRGRLQPLRVSSGCLRGLPWWLRDKESTCKAGAMCSVSGSGRSHGGGHGNPLQYSCLENPMDRGALTV